MPLWLVMVFRSIKILTVPLLLLIAITACKTSGKKQNIVPAADIDTVVRRMSDLMVHDVTNPPLAARFFAYSFLAGYEVISQNNPAIKSLKEILNNYPEIEKPSIKKYDYQLAALLAIIETATRIQPSGMQLQALKEKILKQVENDLDEEAINGSITYANAITTAVLKYAREDGYRSFSDYPRYSPVNSEGSWFPTPPGYIAAVEPYFGKLRLFFLDSVVQFMPPLPVPFSKNKSSVFYALMDSVYQTGKNLTKEQQEIAAFWDCNPFALNDQGHLKVGIKKISPGAHWMGIAGIACAQENLSFDSSMMIHSMLALTLTDAFICCWNEKYRSNRIRPETAIRKYIDPEWKPLLQTPPFPEYISGHSAVSGASAEVLSYFFGDNFNYRDSVEQDFGLPSRSFHSFKEAAQEAAISRYYGGIHFMDANINGLQLGEKIGKHILSRYLKQSHIVSNAHLKGLPDTLKTNF
jgi:hypothetical protein